MVDHPREDDSLPEVAALVKSRRPLHAGVVDGLVLVDLADTDPKLLARYMGKPGAERVLAQWRVAVHGVECGDDAPR